MSEPTSMALVLDKRQQQHRRRSHGGCVGILFHLFDWNRRRGKLFPKRLPPPKNKPPIPFAADEKRMPISKFLLIADEADAGEFQHSGKRPPDVAGQDLRPRGLRRSVTDGGMRSPGPVARLMGLDMIPAVSSERPRRAVDSAFSEVSSGSSSRHDLNLEVGGRGRPPKLQRTGTSGESAVACGGRIHEEAMQIGRSVISKARKQQHQHQYQRKLASPVKSPRLLSRRNSTRLIEAAARILEPALQQRSKPRCALTYGGTGRGANLERAELSPGNAKRSGDVVSARVGPCGSRVLEFADSKKKNEENTVVESGTFGERNPGKINSASRVFDNVGIKKTRMSDAVREERTPKQLKEKGVVRSEEHSRRRLQLASKQQVAKGKRDSRVKTTVGQNPRIVIRDNKPARRQELCRRQNSRKDLTISSIAPKEDVVVSRRKPCVPACAPKASKLPSKGVGVGSEMVASERKTVPHKRRSDNGSQVARQQGLKSNSYMQGNVIPARADRHSSSMKVTTRTSAIQSKKPNVDSFALNSPFTQEMQPSSSNSVEKDGVSAKSCLNESITQREEAIAVSNMEIVSSQRVATLDGDELGGLLEQKIRELNYLHQRAGDGESVVKSTTLILEELISALTKGRGGAPFQKKAEKCDDTGGSQTDSFSYSSPDRSHGRGSQSCKEHAKGVSTLLSSEMDCNQPSPVSILEASFSTDSSLSESMFGTSGHELPEGRAAESWQKSEVWDPEADFLDSATSGTSNIANPPAILPTLDSISIMYGADGCFGSSNIKPNFAREVVSKAELLLCSEIQDSCDAVEESPVDALLLDFVELLAAELDATAKCGSSSMVGKETISNHSLTRGFLLDCIIENLDIISCRYWRSISCLSQNRLPLTPSCDQLISEIHSDILNTRCLAGKIIDEIISEEMNHPKGKWADLQDEAVEAGMDIEHDLFVALVDEMASDLFLQ